MIHHNIRQEEEGVIMTTVAQIFVQPENMSNPFTDPTISGLFISPEKVLRLYAAFVIGRNWDEIPEQEKTLFYNGIEPYIRHSNETHSEKTQENVHPDLEGLLARRGYQSFHPEDEPLRAYHSIDIGTHDDDANAFLTKKGFCLNGEPLPSGHTAH